MSYESVFSKRLHISSVNVTSSPLTNELYTTSYGKPNSPAVRSISSFSAFMIGSHPNGLIASKRTLALSVLGTTRSPLRSAVAFLRDVAARSALDNEFA